MKKTAMNDNFGLAMAAAREYRELYERGDMARLPGLRNDIDGWVGKWQTVDGKEKLVIPDAVRAAMGLEPNHG